jgi:hypothetical protein
MSYAYHMLSNLEKEKLVIDLYYNERKPSPFNGIAQAVYSSFEGPKKDKVDEVLKFLEKIQSQTKAAVQNTISR